MAAIEPAVRNVVADLLDPLVAAGGGDICAGFTHRLPGYVLAEFFNLTPELGMAIRDATREFVDAVQRFRAEDVKRTSLALYEIAQALIDMRRAEPLDEAEDPVTGLLAARVDGEPLPGGHAARDDPPVHRRRHGRSVCVHREHGRPPRRAPRVAGRAAQRSVARARGGRGVPAAPHALPRLRAHADPGRRGRRAPDSQGRAGRARVRVGEPRRVGVPRARALRAEPPGDRQASGIRGRAAPLRRRAARRADASRDPGGAARAHALDRGRRRGDDDRLARVGNPHACRHGLHDGGRLRSARRGVRARPARRVGPAPL